MANVTADCPARLAQPIATAHCSISITMPDSQAAKPSLNTWEFQIDLGAWIQTGLIGLRPTVLYKFPTENILLLRI